MLSTQNNVITHKTMSCSLQKLQLIVLLILSQRTVPSPCDPVPSLKGVLWSMNTRLLYNLHISMLAALYPPM